MNIKFKYKEGDIVSIIIEDMEQQYMVTGMHYINGGYSYTLSNGAQEFIKYEYELVKSSHNSNSKPKVDVGFHKIGKSHNIEN